MIKQLLQAGKLRGLSSLRDCENALLGGFQNLLRKIGRGLRVGKNFSSRADQLAQRCLVAHQTRVLTGVRGGGNAFRKFHQIRGAANIIKNAAVK